MARNPELNQMRLAIEALKRGDVIAYPTESVFGLGCRADDRSAVMRILELKGRPVEQGVIVLIGRLDQLGDWVKSLDSDQLGRLEATWPGPVTWLLPVTDRCPTWLRGAHDTLAVRHSPHPVCEHLVTELDTPLVSTSANRSGEAPARTAAEVRAAFPEGIDYIVDSPVGDAAAPSEIRDLKTGRRLR